MNYCLGVSTYYQKPLSGAVFKICLPFAESLQSGKVDKARTKSYNKENEKICKNVMYLLTPVSAMVMTQFSTFYVSKHHNFSTVV